LLWWEALIPCQVQLQSGSSTSPQVTLSISIAYFISLLYPPIVHNHRCSEVGCGL